MRSWDAIRLWKKSWVFVASLHCIWNVTEIMEKTDDEYDYSTTTAASKLAKTHITHEMILFEMCIFQIPSDFTFFSYPAWTIQGITTSFDKDFVKARIVRKSFFIKYLLGHPVIYPENIAWQTFSKTFTKVKIFFQILVERPSQSYACTLHPLGYASPQHSLIKQSNSGHWTPR